MGNIDSLWRARAAQGVNHICCVVWFRPRKFSCRYVCALRPVGQLVECYKTYSSNALDSLEGRTVMCSIVEQETCLAVCQTRVHPSRGRISVEGQPCSAGHGRCQNGEVQLNGLFEPDAYDGASYP